MENKIIGIFIFTLLITSFFPVAGLAENLNVLSYSNKTIINGNFNGDILDQQQTIDIGYGWWVLHNVWEAQGFVPSLPILTRVRLYMFELGSPATSELIVTIRDELTGEDLTEVLGYGLSGSQWIEFDFPDIEVVPGEDYYIVCKASEGNDIDNCYCWFFGIDDPYPAGGAWYSTNYGSTWEIREYPPWEWYDNDFCFETYGLEQWYPDIPDIDGQTEGTAGEEYEYTFVTTDPEEDDISYYVDWGDDTTTEWTEFVASGTEIILSHTWEEQGTYTIKAKAKDVHEAESDWGYLEVEMPVDQELPSNQFILYMTFQ